MSYMTVYFIACLFPIFWVYWWLRYIQGFSGGLDSKVISLQCWTEFSWVAQSCPTLCNPMDYSTPGLPVHHQLLELTQTHVHWIGDTIQPSHPLSSPSPSAFNLSQYKDLFQWDSSSHQVAKVLEFQLQPLVLPMNIQDWSPLGWVGSGWTGWISLQSNGLSSLLQHLLQKHQLFSTQLSL